METRFTFLGLESKCITKIVLQLKGGATSKEKVVSIKEADLDVKMIKFFSGAFLGKQREQKTDGITSRNVQILHTHG